MESVERTPGPPDPVPSLLHALYAPGTLLVWGEAAVPLSPRPDAAADGPQPSAGTAERTVLARRIRVRLNGPPGSYDRGLAAMAAPAPGAVVSSHGDTPWAIHPSAVPSAWLRAWIDSRPRGAARARTGGAGRLPSTPRTTAARDVDAAMALPARAGAPLPSPGLGGERAAAGALGAWRVPGLLIALRDAGAWLTPHAPAHPALRLAPEWRTWWALAAVAREAVARGHVAPSLAPAWLSAAPVPVWRPVLDPAALSRLYGLAEQLPPAALALWPGDPADAALQLVWEVVDSAVRAQLAHAKVRAAQAARHADVWGDAEALVRALAASRPQALAYRQGLTRDTLAWLADPLGADPEPTVVLRLDEPGTEEAAVGDDDPGGRWPLRVFLRPAHDPDGLVPAAQVWEQGDGLAAFRTCGCLRAASHLAQRLRVAKRLVPEIGGLAEQREETAWLDGPAAWRLLSTVSPKLRAAGFEMLVPSFWAHPPRARLHLEVPEGDGSGLFRAEDLVRFSWEVAIGGRTLTAAEFEALVARRTPLCRLNGSWVALPPEQARAIAERLREGEASGEVGAGQAVLMAARAEAEGEPEEDGQAVRADGAMLALMRRLADSAVESAEPAGFHGALRPYQRRGLAWLATRASLGLGGILADDMGLGKTVQVLALLLRRRREGTAGPVLVVSPTSVVSNWQAEAERFAPDLAVVAHQGADRTRGGALTAACAKADLVLTSYAVLTRDVAALAAVRWDGVILDEAQYVKNATTKQAQAARRLPARYRLALTGTPVENALSDLWSICTFIAPGYLGSAEAFRRGLALPIERQRDQGAARTLRRLVTPLVLRRTKDEPGVSEELPPRIETTERCHLTEEQAALYEAVARELLRRIQETQNGMQRRAAVLVALLRLKQVCNHPTHYTGDARPLDGRSGKLARLEELLGEVVAEGQRALVFTQYAAFGRRLADHLRAVLAPCPVLRMDGATSANERSELVRRFQTGDGPHLQSGPDAVRPPSGPCVFVLTVKTGGAGLNLTAARHVFHYDRWWNPAVERQATDRAHRIGQSHAVHVHRFVSVGTLEERIDQLLLQKQDLFDTVLSRSGEAWLTELSDSELRDLLSLRRAALAV